MKKKVGQALKIEHDKYDTSSRRTTSANLHEQFEYALNLNQDIDWGLGKMVEDINPMMAY